MSAVNSQILDVWDVTAIASAIVLANSVDHCRAGDEMYRSRP